MKVFQLMPPNFVHALLSINQKYKWSTTLCETRDSLKIEQKTPISIVKN